MEHELLKEVQRLNYQLSAIRDTLYIVCGLLTTGLLYLVGVLPSPLSIAVAIALLVVVGLWRYYRKGLEIFR